MQASSLFQVFRTRGQVRRDPVRTPIKSLIPFLKPLITILVLLAGWQLITVLELYPSFIIPPPLAVGQRFIDVLLSGQLWLHTSTTLSQMIPGLFAGVLIAVALGFVLAKNPLLETLLSPVIVAVQSTPVVAYAPLLVIWFGTGSTSKIVTTALIVFFPMLMNTIIGIRGVPPDQRELLESFNANRWQTFVKLELPSSLPVLLGGLKVSATLAVIGAVVGEFISADAGLGRLINIARYDFDTPLVFVAIIMLAVIARTMYGLVSLLERRLLTGRRRID